MKSYYYDLHVHSCLSPCADNDMTPNSIAGMASLAGLDIVALTDHNSTKNCPAFFKAAKRYGVVPVAGMELTTNEDIHIICLFERLEDAMDFGAFVDRERMRIKNRPSVFGDQLIIDEDDNITGSEEFLLHTAAALSSETVTETVSSFNGICYPAHIDRSANGIISILGAFPEKPSFNIAELNNINNKALYTDKYPALKNKMLVTASDAHRLCDIRDAESSFLLPDGLSDEEEIRHELFIKLKSRI